MQDKNPEKKATMQALVKQANSGRLNYFYNYD